MFQRLQVVPDLVHTRLGGVRAIAIASPTVNCGAESPAAIPVLNPPIVRAGNRVRIFDFVHRTGVWSATPNEFIVRWLGWISVFIAEPEGVAETKHDTVGTCAAHHRLVIVVTHRVM